MNLEEAGSTPYRQRLIKALEAAFADSENETTEQARRRYIELATRFGFQPMDTHNGVMAYGHAIHSIDVKPTDHHMLITVDLETWNQGGPHETPPFFALWFGANRPDRYWRPIGPNESLEEAKIARHLTDQENAWIAKLQSIAENDVERTLRYQLDSWLRENKFNFSYRGLRSAERVTAFLKRHMLYAVKFELFRMYEINRKTPKPKEEVYLLKVIFFRRNADSTVEEDKPLFWARDEVK